MISINDDGNSTTARFTTPVILLFLFLIAFVLLSLPQITSAQEELALLFHDDFEDGFADDWELGLGWWIDRGPTGNHSLMGEGHNWATPSAVGWVDYVIEAQVKLLQGGFHLNFRMSEQRVSAIDRIFARYFLAFHENELHLVKQIGADFFQLDGGLFPLERDIWYTVRIVLQGASIEIYLDDVMRISFMDRDSPLLFGIFAFETLDDSLAQFDDVTVFGEEPMSFVQEASWTKMGGPSGGLGYDIRIHPSDKNIMFVTDNPSGVNKSYDAGSTWTQNNDGIKAKGGPSGDGTPIFSLTIDPGDSGIVWAGTQDIKGIYKSTDGGETWKKMDSGVVENNGISFRGFGVDPNNSDIVFAGAEIEAGVQGIEFSKVKGKIYRTEDAGKNWRSVWEGDSLARFIIIDPTTTGVNSSGQVYSKVVYASTGIFDREAFNDEDDEPVGVGILKSVDGGNTWRQINNGITNPFVGFLEMHPTDPKTLFAAAGNNGWQYPPNNLMGGIYRTKDGGDNWEQVLFEDIFTVVTFSPSNPNVIYAGSAGAFYRSDDGGDNWRTFSKTEGGYGPSGVMAGFPISAVVDPDDPMTVFANNYGGGNFMSTDGGQPWVNASKGYTGSDLRDIAIDPDNPGIVYTIGRSGPFRSFNGGEDWTGIAFPPATTSALSYAIAVNPDNPRETLIGDEHSGVMFRSADGGNTWKEVFRHPNVRADNPNNRHGIRTIAYAPSDTRIIYAGMSVNMLAAEGLSAAIPSFGIYRSIDGGNTWMEKNTGLESSDKNITDIAVHPMNPDIAYAGAPRDGVYKTVNGGENWTLVSNGLASANVQCLAINPADSEVVYAGLGEGRGIFMTINGGELWQEINEGIALACPPSLLPVGKVTQGISLQAPSRAMFTGRDYRSISWTVVKSIIVDPANPQTIYAADYNSGVYMSMDGGMNWQIINDGLSTRAVSAMAISSNGKVLYAATSGAGVFRLLQEPTELNEIYKLTPWDVNKDKVVNVLDLIIIASHFDEVPLTNPDADVNDDGIVDVSDLVLVGQHFGEDYSSSSSSGPRNDAWHIDPEHLPVLEIIYNFMDRSTRSDERFLATKRLIRTLISVASGNIAESKLLQNYPNPFNPDTWIPYQLAEPGNVTIGIYNVSGQLMRKLDLGYKVPGFYTGKRHAAYWDGNNDYGEQVSSGVYFYTIYSTSPAAEFTAARKMILMK